MHSDLLRRYPTDLAAHHLHARLVLRRRPDVYAVGAHVRGAIHRLHRGVREERHFVHGLDALHRCRQRGDRVAVVSSDGAILGGALRKQAGDARAGDLGDRAFIPGDLQGVATLFRRPIAVADHGDAARDLHDVADAGDCLRGGCVKAHDFAAEHRAARNERGQHARHAHVDSELRCAVHLEARVEAFRRLASEAPVLRIFELHVRGNRKRRRSLRQRSVGEPPVGRGMNHRPRFSAAARRLDAPRLRRRRNQHGACLRACLAQRLPGRAHTRAAPGALNTEELIDVGFVSGRKLETDLCPIGLELFGQQHRQRGRHPLAHLRAIDDHQHTVVGADAQPRIGCKGCHSAPIRDLEPDHQAGADGAGHLKKRAPFHQASFAARWIAARMRW